MDRKKMVCDVVVSIKQLLFSFGGITSNNEESSTVTLPLRNFPNSHGFQPFPSHSLWLQLLIFHWKKKMYDPFMLYLHKFYTIFLP